MISTIIIDDYSPVTFAPGLGPPPVIAGKGDAKGKGGQPAGSSNS